MKIFWKDRVDDSDNWSHLEVTVSDTSKPRSQIQAGGNRRFKLSNDQETIFWACIESDYYGVWFLRNDRYWEKEQMFIPPITSSDIEESMEKGSMKDAAYWSRFFIKSLSESKSSFLNDGKWKISEAHFKRDSIANGPFEKWKVDDVLKTFEREQLSYIDWDHFGDSMIIPIKKSPQETDGRLKWWRKKVKEGTCPPVLTWYVNSLDAFLLIDGHYRLKAYVIENKLPKVLVLNEIMETHFKKGDKLRDKILKGIEKRQENQHKDKLNINEMNRLLIHAFDDRPSIRPITKSIGKPDFEKSWINEVLTFKSDPSVDQEDLNLMIEND